MLFYWWDEFLVKFFWGWLVWVGLVVGGAGRESLEQQLSLEGVGSGGCNLILWSNSSFNLRSIINIVLQGPKRLHPLARPPHNKPTLLLSPLSLKKKDVHVFFHQILTEILDEHQHTIIKKQKILTFFKILTQPLAHLKVEQSWALIEVGFS